MVFDETIHGYVAAPVEPVPADVPVPVRASPPRRALIAIALLLWATMGRFGAPQSAPAALSAGRAGLLENMAKLIEFAGHQQVMIARYVQETVRDVARQLHAPRGLAGAPLVEWLRRVGTARGVGDRLRRAHPAGRRAWRETARRTCRRWCGWRAILTDGREKSSMDVQDIRAIAESVRGEVRKAVVGQDEVIELMLTSLLVGGHILLEGVPGTAKTLMTQRLRGRPARCSSAASSSRPT